MLLIFGVLLVFIFGYILSVVLVGEMHLLERVGVSYLLGFGIFTLLMFCYSTLGIKITLQSTLIALAIGIGSLLLLSKILKRKFSTNLFDLFKSIRNFSRLEKIIVFIIAMLGVGSLIITTYFPVYIWDALALYDFRAKMIAQFGFYTQIANNYVWFGGYPLFTSLSHTLVYIFRGNNPQFLYSFMYISFIFIFYGALRELIDRKVALIASLILATIPVFFDHSTFAYTNLPYSIFLSMGSIYLYVWFIKKKPIGYLMLSAIMTGLSTWTRSAEPFWMVNIVLLAILSIYGFKRYLLPSIVYIFTFLLIKYPWVAINNYIVATAAGRKVSIVAFEETPYLVKLFQNLFDFPRMAEVWTYIYKYVVSSWYPFLFLFLLCFLLNVKVLFRKLSSLFLLIIFLYFGLLLIGTYLFSFGPSSWGEIPDSARRMSMFFIPLMIYYVGLTIGSELTKKKWKKEI